MDIREQIYEGIVDMVDGTYDVVLFDNDTKKMDIDWVNDCCFAITLYYKSTDTDDDGWDDEWVDQANWSSENFFENYSELFSGEVNVIEEMTNDIMNYING